MEDYPRNLKEFDVRFRSDEACREYLLELRWPDGFRCPQLWVPREFAGEDGIVAVSRVSASNLSDSRHVGAAIVANDFGHKNVVMYGGLADVNPLNTWTWDGMSPIQYIP